VDHSLVVVTDGFVEGSHPDTPLPVTEDLQNLQIGQSVPRRKIPELRSVEAAHAGIGARPEESILILCDAV